jgi:tetratricopeptide (TPR) repeat protein
MTIKPTLCAVLALTATAAADNAKKADDLFKQAKKLMADKRYSEACPKFEDSNKLDPGIGGQLNIGKCYEEWGKIGRAYRAYAEAEAQAKESKDPRLDKIHELVAAIEPQVPKLTIRVAPDADTDGLKVTIDGVPVGSSDFGQPQRVDPGPKTVEYTLHGKKSSQVIAVERGGASDLTLELPKAKGVVTKPVEPPKVVEPPDPGRTQRIVGIAVGAAGLVGIGVSSYMALSARGKYNDALAAHCMGMPNMCDDVGLTDTHDARHTANIATIVFSVGLAATAGGVVIYLLAPKAPKAVAEHALYLVPTTTPDGAGIAFGGRL